MTQTDKENFQNKILTASLIIRCLATCETVIGKNAYLEKKWNNYYVCSDQSASDEYRIKRLAWMKHREKLRSLLLPIYSMKQIIQMTKSCTDKVSQKVVEEVMGLIDKKDYVVL